MAKESMKAREVKRAKLAKKYAAKREALKKIVNTGTPEEAYEAARKLQALPLNSNPIRMHNRCKLTGRPKGYILNYKFVEDGPQGTIKIALKYDAVNKVNAIKKLIRVSSPGLRRYTGYKDMPRVINGLGIAILSTSKGVMTDKEAATEKIGGEVLCYVY